MARKRAAKLQTAEPMVDDSWRAREDLSTLTRAHEIAADKQRLAAAQREARKQQQSLSRVSRLSTRKI